MPQAIPVAAAAFANWAFAATGLAYGTAAHAIVTATLYYGAQAALYSAVSMGLTAIAQAQAPDPEGQKVTRKQARPIRVHAVGGPSRMSGAYMLREAVGNKYGAVLAVCEGRLASVDAVYEHDNLITRNSDGWVQGMAGEQFGSGDLLRVQTRLGNPTETHYSMLTPNFGAYWPTSARGDGIASIGIFAQHRSRESFARHFPNGEPVVSIVAAAVCYDWRDPSQSRTDPSTWKASWNPVVWLVFVEWHRHGRRWERSIAPVLDQLTAEADYCDQIVTRSGVTEARYRCAGNYPVNTEPQAVREALLSTFDGWMSLDGRGRLIIKAGRYVEPTFALTGEHIQGYSWRAFQTDEEACNALVVSFVDPAKDYTEVEAGTLFDQDDIDGRNGVERSEALQLPWCPSGTQAMELARRKMTRLTAERRGQVRASVYGLNGLGERFIRIQNPELNSMADVVVEVTNVELDMANAQVVFDVVLADTQIDVGEAAAPSVPPVEKPPVVPGEQEPARRLINLSVPYPTSATSDTISILAFSGVLPDGSTLNLPAATITGLAALTQYGVFWRSDVGYAALPGDFAANALALGSWVFIGWQATSDGSGGYPTSPPSPPGWGGGGSSPIYERQVA
ncbi:phage tail protein [Brevundimonas vesicularis]|uniref:phage tail protein n=1 Tax=Brevundimonas vesicularis TaxID=41276 RepID=UPI0022EC94BC|nr:phage tail protein [Brevundimonas vesicularis]WBT06660.1 phage tail protein [Brevundimonas vesicularis]